MSSVPAIDIVLDRPLTLHDPEAAHGQHRAQTPRAIHHAC